MIERENFREAFQEAENLILYHPLTIGMGKLHAFYELEGLEVLAIYIDFTPDEEEKIDFFLKKVGLFYRKELGIDWLQGHVLPLSRKKDFEKLKNRFFQLVAYDGHSTSFRDFVSKNGSFNPQDILENAELFNFDVLAKNAELLSKLELSKSDALEGLSLILKI